MCSSSILIIYIIIYNIIIYIKDNIKNVPKTGQEKHPGTQPTGSRDGKWPKNDGTSMFTAVYRRLATCVGVRRVNLSEPEREITNPSKPECEMVTTD